MVEPISAALLLNALGARTGGGDAADGEDEDADEDTLAKSPLTPTGTTFDGDGDDDEDADEGSFTAPFLLTPTGTTFDGDGDDDEDNSAKAPGPSPLTRVAAERGRGDGGFVCEDDVDDHGDGDAVAATAMDFFDFAR